MATIPRRREAATQRPLSTRIGWLKRADGSSTFAFGAQASTVSVIGPTEVRIRDEITDRALLQVVYSPLDGSAGIPTKAAAEQIHGLFQAVLLLHHHPRTLIQLTVQTTGRPSASEDAGTIPLQERDAVHSRKPLLLGPDADLRVSEMAASINASMLALLDAAIPMRATVVAASCAVLEPSDAAVFRENAQGQKPIVVVDPTPEEEEVASSCHVFAFAFSAYEPLVPHGNVQARQVYAASYGKTSLQLRPMIVNIARDSAQATYEHIRQALEPRCP